MFCGGAVVITHVSKHAGANVWQRTNSFLRTNLLVLGALTQSILRSQSLFFGVGGGIYLEAKLREWSCSFHHHNQFRGYIFLCIHLLLLLGVYVSLRASMLLFTHATRLSGVVLFGEVLYRIVHNGQVWINKNTSSFFACRYTTSESESVSNNNNEGFVNLPHCCVYVCVYVCLYSCLGLCLDYWIAITGCGEDCLFWIEFKLGAWTTRWK